MQQGVCDIGIQRFLRPVPTAFLILVSQLLQALCQGCYRIRAVGVGNLQTYQIGLHDVEARRQHVGHQILGFGDTLVDRAAHFDGLQRLTNRATKQ